MLRRLFTPRWLGALLAAVVYAVGAWYLGGWQYGRHLEKVERNALLDAHYAAAPVPLDRVLAERRVTAGDQWTHVTATGTYSPTQLYVRNRPNTSVYGYEILAVLEVGAGRAVLVDRGWVENSTSGADVLPPVPPPPSGDVTVVGWVRRGEPSLGRHLPQGQLASINVSEASRAFGVPLRDGYVVLDSERSATGATPPRPEPLERPDRSLGPHQAYAFQWWFSMPVGLVLTWFGIRRELRREDPDWVPKEKKPSLWDEEDE